jgi:hypothetical protein
MVRVRRLLLGLDVAVRREWCSGVKVRAAAGRPPCRAEGRRRR